MALGSHPEWEQPPPATAADTRAELGWVSPGRACRRGQLWVHRRFLSKPTLRLSTCSSCWGCERTADSWSGLPWRDSTWSSIKPAGVDTTSEAVLRCGAPDLLQGMGKLSCPAESCLHLFGEKRWRCHYHF